LTAFTIRGSRKYEIAAIRNKPGSEDYVAYSENKAQYHFDVFSRPLSNSLDASDLSTFSAYRLINYFPVRVLSQDLAISDLEKVATFHGYLLP